MKQLIFETLKVADLNAWDISISLAFTTLLIVLIIRQERKLKQLSN